MIDHKNRMQNIFGDAFPRKGTLEYEKVNKYFAQKPVDPRTNKEIKKRFEKAQNTLIVQDASSLKLGIDSDLRHFLREFNERAWRHGLMQMPSMFNILESFFRYDKQIIYFELIEEENYLVSLFDFIDYYTSGEFKSSIDIIKDSIEKDLIYNFHVGSDIEDLTFSSETGKKYAIAGLSLIRREQEVTVLLQTGEKTDTNKVTEKLKNFEGDFNVTTKGKENIYSHESLKLEAVSLNGNPNYWKTLVACRIDLESQTIDSRYLARDNGTHFDVSMDEIADLLDKDENFRILQSEGYFQKIIDNLNDCESLFEFAKAALFLPYFINENDDKLLDEDHSTDYKELIRRPLERRKYRNVNNHLKKPTMTLWVLNTGNKFSPDKIKLRDDLFKIETSSYWKKLLPDEVGTDKNGKRITGKTWVNRHESFFLAKNAELIVEKTCKRKFENHPNSGYIYVLRNPGFKKNVFKIGLTTKTPDERASQLSKTSNIDKFYVMNEWEASDCYQAEKEIHLRLDSYRIDKRREFFALEFKDITKIIEEVIEEVNEKYT